ncbi:MAG: GAF domain-containing protein, partial [Candidatus Aquicultor sp.]|nr:GAF domain-containing protein [Candidatus Aquicultor sp.]
MRERVKAESEIRKRIEDLEALKKAALDISLVRERDELYATIVKSVVKLLSCDAGGIAIFDENEHMISFPYVWNLPASLTTQSIRHGSDIFSEVISAERSLIITPGNTLPAALRVLSDEGIRSFALVPLIVRGRILGTLWAATRMSARTFTNYDMVLLESIGAQASVSLDNVSLFIEQQYISDVLQRGFLPDKIPNLQQTDIGIFYASATEAAVVGGDFYDFVPLANEIMALALGDSSGKGVEATADAAMVKYSLHAALHSDPDPAKTLTHSNAVAFPQLKNGHFVTLVYGLY